jgi:hypothetical protein
MGRARSSLRPTGPSRACWRTSGQGENGFRVVDVWESENAFRSFGETLMPILQDMGVEGQPEIYPAHAFVSA